MRPPHLFRPAPFLSVDSGCCGARTHLNSVIRGRNVGLQWLLGRGCGCSGGLVRVCEQNIIQKVGHFDEAALGDCVKVSGGREPPKSRRGTTATVAGRCSSISRGGITNSNGGVSELLTPGHFVCCRSAGLILATVGIDITNK